MGEEHGQLSELDLIAEQLQQLRVAAGSPSYAEIARLVGELRTRRTGGMSGGRPGKTTVYDVFRYGRRRLDADLALEIAAVLGCDDAEIDALRCRYAIALRNAAVSVPKSRTPSVPAAPAVQAPGTPLSIAPASAAPESESPEEQPEPTPSRLRLVWLVLAVSLALNVLCGRLAAATHLPLYLDMVGTAVAAVVLGPWWGALIGALTNLTEVVPLNLDLFAPHWDALPFAVVNVAGALVWGYGVRRYGYGRTLPRYFALSLIVAVACTFVAVPAIVVLGQDASDLSIRQITATFDSALHDAIASLFSSNLLTSLADKLISGFVALTAIEMLPGRLRASGRELTLNGTLSHNRVYAGARRESLWRLGPPLRTGL